MGKKILWTAIVLVLIAAVAVGAYFFLRPDTQSQPPEQATEQTAAKNPAQTEQIPEQTEQIPEPTEKKTDFNVVIVHKDGTQKEMTLKIQEEFLGAALINAGVIEAEENRFGMHIKKADGEILMPSADTHFESTDHILVIGKKDEVLRYISK